MITPSLLLPDLPPERGVVSAEAGARRILFDRMRVVTRDDGTLERAPELLPIGEVFSLELPSRLGGGFLFHARSGGAKLWRSASWLGKLEPLAQISQRIEDVIPGFDRLYLRQTSNNKLLALDPKSGDLLSLGPLPPAGSYGALGFADGWRAVVDADLLGPLATFDAGATWRPLGIDQLVSSVPILDGDPAILVSGGRYVLDTRGVLTYRPDPPRSTEPQDDDTPPQASPGPFGRKPLRAAVEDGFPESATTAVVARGGSLARVSLVDGALLAVTEQAYEEREASCHAVRVGRGWGFVCGERDGATVVYAFAPERDPARHLGLVPVLRFARPRFVSSSGNGALVVRGACTDTPPLTAARVYCVRGASGRTREIRVKGDVGAERVVALADGAVAVVVPPRPGAPPQLSIIRGNTAKTVRLTLPTEPRTTARVVASGMWLEGFEEREPGVLGGWVEAGGPMVGIRVALDGKVTAGEPREDVGGVVVSGRFALARFQGNRAAESTDGGMSWSLFDMPDFSDELPPGGTRACGAVGCALAGWIRVGWGPPRMPNDFALAETPPPVYVPMRSPTILSLSCELASAGAKSTRASHESRSSRPRPSVVGRTTRVAPASSWPPFRGIAAPSLGPDEVGVDGGAFGDVALRAYAWGKRGSDWSRSGRLAFRFDDRFDAVSGVRSTAPSVSPWPDETAAIASIGGYTSWGAFLDPSGDAAIAEGCRGSGCALYALAAGQPALPLRDESGRTTPLPKPLPGGAVRLGETWYLLAPVVGAQPTEALGFFRVDLGVLRRVRLLQHPSQSRYAGVDAPRLVRRAQGGGLGLLVVRPPSPGEAAGTWFVLPIDPESGALGEPIELGRRDRSSLGRLERCSPGQDGWIFDTGLDAPTIVELGDAPAPLHSIELRVRLDPGSACIDGLAASLSAPLTSSSPRAHGGHAPVGEEGLPLTATERATGSRAALRCRAR
jgi:hypothetical protein